MVVHQGTAKRSERGFTLIELLIVMVVLGVLSGIVVYSLNSITGQSVQAACNSDAKSVETAVAAYEAQNSSAPDAVDGSGQAWNSAGQKDAAPFWYTDYLKSWPTSNASHYEISTDASGQVSVTLSGGSATPYTDGGNACSTSAA